MEGFVESEIITLGKCSNFLMTILGDFCSQNGMTAKIQKDYKDENTKSAFGKYNLDDEKSTLSGIKYNFYKRAFFKYKGFSRFSFLMLHFPSFLQKSIKYIDQRIYDYFNESQIIIFLLVNYVAYHYKNAEFNEKKFFLDFFPLHITNTYNDLLKDTKVNFKTLAENCKWASLEEILEAANSHGVYDNEKELIYDCMVLVQHYLFLRFVRALKEVFIFSDEEIKNLEVWIFNKTDDIVSYQNYHIQTFAGDFYDMKQLPIDNSENVIFSLLNIDTPAMGSMFYTEKNWMSKVLQNGRKHKEEIFHPNTKVDATLYFVNSHARITKNKADEYIRTLESFNDEYYNNVIIPWYKARVAIFRLTFTDKKRDKELKEEACRLFRDIFNNYKYFIGNNLAEFLSDAIACDVYCNSKKDIFDNAQDNTDESSITLPGKAYWEFGYALGIFDADSKKTYLLTFNAESNFWTNFPPTKFENQENAFKKFCSETINSEFELPLLLKDFNDPIKIDNLGSLERKDFRQPLGNRYYSNLSIRCLKANLPDEKSKSPSDFTFIKNYINKNRDNPDLLFTNDENGANALIRSLKRYKMLSYGYTDGDIVERGQFFTDFHKKWYHGRFNYIMKNCLDSGFSESQNNEGLNQYIEKAQADFFNDICPFYNDAPKKAESTKEERESLKVQLKENIILPLIKYAGKHISDEAIVLDGKKCVSALQIAIDCFDYEIVKAIVENLPGNTELAKIYISSEYVTPLQYAIRKYDYLMQYSEMIFSKDRSICPIERRAVHSRKKVDKGILDYDRDFYSKQDFISAFMETSPQEECGLGLTYHRDETNKNIVTVQQKNLIEIIKLLAQKTNPISVDTFYYLADIIDPNDGHVFTDIFDITKILIDTGHAELGGTDFEWERFHYEPTQTLLAYCINHTKKDENPNHHFQQKNYDMLAYLLSNYSEIFKPIINKLIIGFDKGRFRRDTDLHFFITNQIESIKAWNDPNYAFDKNMKDEEYRNNYGQQIAYRMNLFLTLFMKAGARFDIPDHDGKTALDYLREWKVKMPEGCLPDEIVKMV